MPVVRAADYPYAPYPTTEGPQGLPNVYQSLQTTPAMFGALTGEALEKLGGQLGQAGNTLAGTAIDIQKLHNSTVVDQQITSYQEKVNKVLYGDPNNPNDMGYMGLRGQAALDARAGVNAQLEQLRKDHEAQTQNMRQRLDFNTQSRRFNSYATTEMNKHYEQQFKQNAHDVMVGRAGIGITNSGIAANNGDFEAFKSAWGSGRAAYQDSMTLMQVPPELQEAKLREYDEKVVYDWTTKLAVRDPVAADAFADANRDYMPTKYDEAKRAVKAEKEKADIEFYKNGVGTRPGAPNMVPRQPNLPAGTFFNRIVNAGERSAQSAVSPSGAVGVSQIKPETAQEVASERGIPYDEERLRTDEKYNRQLGAAYADKLLTKYQGNEMLAAAAYNAGPGKVDEWIKDIGDPRSGKISPEEWARKIPADETRAYVYRVAPPGRATPSSALNYIPGGVPFPTQARPNPPPMRWTNEFPADPTQPDKSGSTSYGPGSPYGRTPPPSSAASPASDGSIEVWGDSLGMGLNSRLQTSGQSTGGAQPQAIFAAIKKKPEDSWQGKRVVLASGSNGNQMDTVEETAQYLKDRGADVVLVGYGPKFEQKNARLAAIANKVGARIIPAEGVDPKEGVHPGPEGYDAMVRSIRLGQTKAGDRSSRNPTLTPPGATAPEPAPGSGGGIPAEVADEAGGGGDDYEGSRRGRLLDELLKEGRARGGFKPLNQQEWNLLDELERGYTMESGLGVARRQAVDKEMLKDLVRRKYRLGRTAEDTLDEYVDSLRIFENPGQAEMPDNQIAPRRGR